MVKPESLQPVGASMLSMLEEATTAYQAGRPAAVDEYLEARGIAREAADTARLGCVVDSYPGHERMRGWLSIPFLGCNWDGVEEVRSIRFRCIPELAHPGISCKELGHGKYLGVSGERTHTYNVRALLEAGDEIHLTEGELDAVVLNQAGFPAIGLPGATQWRSYHSRMLAGFSRVFVWADPDEAGYGLLADATQALGARCKPVRLTVGDVGETFMRGGYGALDAALEGARGR